MSRLKWIPRGADVLWRPGSSAPSGLLFTLALGLVVAPVISEAQRAAHMPRVAFLNPFSPTSPAVCPAGFRQGLRDLGYVEGQNILLEYRYAEWQWDRLPTLAAELVQLKPDVMVTNTTPGRWRPSRRPPPSPSSSLSRTIWWKRALSPAWRGPVATSRGEPPGYRAGGQTPRAAQGSRANDHPGGRPRQSACPGSDRVPGNIAEARALGVRLSSEVGDAGASPGHQERSPAAVPRRS